MLNRAAFSQQQTLFTPRLRLAQLHAGHFEAFWSSLHDPESMRLTGTHATFTTEQVRAFLASRPGLDDRADWAVIRQQDDRYLGEVVLNDLDADNRSANFRIALAGEHVLGRGYGTEATRAVVGYGLDVVGLHRISLGVYAFNPRALQVYEKCGFVREGVKRDALLWNGQWVDEIVMSVLAGDPRPPGPPGP